MTDDWHHGGFGVYVHWPFCAAKCPYCDFNSHVRTAVDQDRWRRALVAAVGQAGRDVPGRRVDSIFFGGGTPSLMPPETVAAVLDAIAAAWPVADGAEITLEANPTSVEAGRFRGYRDAGVNRLSMGVQALNDPDLRALGRMHDVGEATAAFDLARVIFPRVSFDLIYARQGQTPAAWRAELERAMAMAVDHLSLYQLTIESGTRFGALAARGKLRHLPDGDTAAAMYLETQDACAAAGMPGYEISNHARPGAEARHNLVYWRYGDYAGIGPGAHGRLTIDDVRLATEAIAMPEAWLAAIEGGGDGMTVRTPVTPDEQALEMMLMGLRLEEGILLPRYERLARRRLPQAAIAELSALGLVSLEGTRLRATATGRPVLNAVLDRLLNGNDPDL